MKTLILSINDIRDIISEIGLNSLMDELIIRMERAIFEFDLDKTLVPAREGFEYHEPHSGLLEWMPLLQIGEQVTMKVVSYHPSNPAVQNIPTIVSSIGTFDVTNGHLVALADATFLTSFRTGAASAVASKVLGNPKSRTIGIIGCGAQAVTQLHALSRIFEFDHGLVYDVDPDASESMSKRAGFTDMEIEISTPEEILHYSDILCTTTSVGKGEGPVFNHTNHNPWLHINAVGSDFPGKFELPVSLLKKSLVCPDFLLQARKEGECQQLRGDEIGPDMVHLVQNRQKYYDARNQLSVFDSTGWAFEDKVAFDMFTEYAAKLDLGTSIQIESTISEDPKNPYEFINEVILQNC
jgi:ornithine cyclodeaminase/alanine dehydrogenase-like protein (mu-crystallin family)